MKQENKLKCMQNTYSEIWKPVKGYENRYEISNKGRVKSLEKKWVNWNGYVAIHPEKILRERINTYGYARVTLRDGRTSKEKMIHRLVAEAFLPNPDNYPEVNHKDENPLNNCVENLEWCTHLYNNRYGTKNRRGALRRGIFVSQYDLKGNFISSYPTIRDAERATGVSMRLICNCVNGVHKQGGGFIWKRNKQGEYNKIIEVEKGERILPEIKSFLTKSSYSYKKDPNYITRKDAASLLKVGCVAFDSYVFKIGYKSIKSGKHRFFKISDIEELCEALKGISLHDYIGRKNAIRKLIDKNKEYL